MILSILVISHNQKDKLRRCLQSILAQLLPFEHEIIISDDASEDGTWELAQEYATRYPQIRAYSCNTTDYQPANLSDRCGWNKCNAYKYATGKYIAHVDGDDFFLEGKDIYKKQVDLLEQNPTCSCCMANNYNLYEGEDVSKATIRHKEEFQTGEIILSEYYIRNYFREFQCFVYRRNAEIDPVKKYGGYYDDALITAHHLQFGNIVCLNDTGYVYVNSESSIWSQQVKCGDDFVFAHALYIPLLIPKWKNVFHTEKRHLVAILQVVFLALSKRKLKENNVRWIERFKTFPYHVFNRDLNVFEKARLLLLSYYLRIMIKFNLRNSLCATILRTML